MMEAYPNAHRCVQQHQLAQKTRPEQLPLLEAALIFWACVGHLALVRRILADVLQHGGVTFPQQTLAALLSSTDRHLRKLKQQAPAARVRPRHFRPAHNLGPLVECLVARPRTTLEEVQAFLHDQLGMQVSRSTVENTLQRYGVSRRLRPKTLGPAGRPAQTLFR